MRAGVAERQTRCVQGAVGASPWGFKSLLRHQPNPGVPAVRSAEPTLHLDREILSHLRGFPEELERYANLVKHAHPLGRSACGMIIHRPGPSGFLRRLCELVASGQSVVTTWEAARLAGGSPADLLERLDRGELPPPEFRDGVRVIWRLEVLEEWLRGRGEATGRR